MKTMVFGYGSLISLSSTQQDAPEVQELRAAYIKGFRRSFSLHDPEGYRSYNLDVAGIPFCGVDVQPSDDPKARVNGVVFEVDESGLKSLLRREQEYEAPIVPVYDFETDKLIGECIIFSACKNNDKYDPTNPAQVRYLEQMLEGAKSFGDKFYQEFIRTTYIGEHALNEMSYDDVVVSV